MKFPQDAKKEKVLKVFYKLGFTVLREGNHIILERINNDGSKTPLVMPNHKTINSGTLRIILTQTGVPRKTFAELFLKT